MPDELPPISSDRSHWEARFADDSTYLFGTEPNAFLVSCAPLLIPGHRALAVADGEGRNSTWLASRGLLVDAFDGSPSAIAKARRLAAARSVEVAYAEAAIEEWPWPQATYDVIAAIFVQFSPPAQRQWVFDRIAAALRPGGRLLLVGYGVGQLVHGTGGPRRREHLYTADLLRAELAPLAIEQLVEREAVVQEGTAHAGLSSLVEVVARRPA